ncbi:AAA family ATPase [Roseomonas genomospecies 6]|uniref:Chromosome partitioning protein n=1 Tax=Roseomonas genomospecies 6 TaxID=214106 RepID=A0A9W7NIR7_9PROT|nr:AAA family ATPase [Roseomonas genomospecies 6]KAA0679822.1 chromosome partitioning protein [Roseomonas genomospecies 6]
MRGEDIKAFREGRTLNQPDFAAWLNEKLGRKYDKAKISRWENGSEKVPAPVISLLLQEKIGPVTRHGPALICAAANRKGGVGKTAFTVNTATLLARHFKVLLIDADPQANATIHLGINSIEREREEKTLYYALKASVEALKSRGKGFDLGDYIVTTDSGLDVIPSGMRLGDAEAELQSQSSGDCALRECLDGGARQSYDFIFVDTPPHFGMLARNALTAANTVAIPCQTEMLSVAGVEFLLENLDMIRRRANPGVSVLGILPTMFNARLTQDQASLDDIRNLFGTKLRVFGPIPRATVYAQAVAAGRAALEAVPDAPGYEVYQAVADALIQERARMPEVMAHVA